MIYEHERPIERENHLEKIDGDKKKRDNRETATERGYMMKTIDRSIEDKQELQIQINR